MHGATRPLDIDLGPYRAEDSSGLIRPGPRMAARGRAAAWSSAQNAPADSSIREPSSSAALAARMPTFGRALRTNQRAEATLPV